MNQLKNYIISSLIFCLILISFSQQEVKGQLGIQSINPDSVRMLEMYDQARTFYSQNMKREALGSAEDGLKLAMRLDQVSYEIRLLEIIGDIYTSNGEHANSIPYYLRKANLLELKK